MFPQDLFHYKNINIKHIIIIELSKFLHKELKIHCIFGVSGNKISRKQFNSKDLVKKKILIFFLIITQY